MKKKPIDMTHEELKKLTTEELRNEMLAQHERNVKHDERVAYWMARLPWFIAGFVLGLALSSISWIGLH